jgi:hypothetical protein
LHQHSSRSHLVLPLSTTVIATSVLFACSYKLAAASPPPSSLPACFWTCHLRKISTFLVAPPPLPPLRHIGGARFPPAGTLLPPHPSAGTLLPPHPSAGTLLPLHPSWLAPYCSTSPLPFAP